MVWNLVRIFLFLIFTSCFILIAGYSVYDRQGLLAAFVLVIFWNTYIYFYSGQRLLDVFSCSQMEGLDPWKVCQTVEQLAGRFDMSTPDIFMIPLETPTVFSVGVRGSLVISKGLVQILDYKQLKTVLAHEVFHIKQLDTLAFSVGSAVMNFCLFWGFVLDQGIIFVMKGVGWRTYQQRFFTYLLTPLALFFLRLIISPKNDYKADRFAALSSEDPEHLAQALWKLSSYSQTKPIEWGSIRNPLTIAHLFIVNPLNQEIANRYFSFMPSVKSRIYKIINRYPI